MKSLANTQIKLNVGIRWEACRVDYFTRLGSHYESRAADAQARKQFYETKLLEMIPELISG